jgi:hypothetical protein
MNGVTVANNIASATPFPGIILNNGSFIAFRYHYNNCTVYNCGWMTVDINGFKKPNIVGKDIYYISINPNKIYPTSVNLNTDCVEGSSISSGMSCSALYLYQ